MTYPDVYLLRHGQTVWNREGRMQGQDDSELTDLGVRQAQQQNALLKELGLDPMPQLFCSPLGRTRQTAQHALQDIPGQVTFDARIQELGVGSWEGQLRDDVIATHPAILDREMTVLERFCCNPDGETFDAAMLRITTFLDELASPAILVTHGIAMTLIRGVLLRLDFEQMSALDHPQGKVIAISSGVEIIHG